MRSTDISLDTFKNKLKTFLLEADTYKHICCICEFGQNKCHYYNYNKQVAQLSEKDHTAGSVSYGQKWKTGTGRQYLRTVYYRSIFNQCDVLGQQSNRNRVTQTRAITAFKVIQGH